MTEGAITPETASWFAISIDTGNDYAALEFKNRHSSKQMIQLVHDHYWPPSAKKARSAATEDDREQDDDDEEIEVTFHFFGPIDANFMQFVGDFQDYDHCKHSDYILLEGDKVRNFGKK